MRLQKFEAEDYYKLEQDENKGLEVWMLEKDIPSALLILENRGTVRSIWLEDKIYGIYGLVETRSSVAEVFFIPSKNWIEKKKYICRAIKNDLEIVKKMFNRIQMTCLETEQFLRFSKFFGFEKEGSLKQYDRFGRTYSMLAITKGVI